MSRGRKEKPIEAHTMHLTDRAENRIFQNGSRMQQCFKLIEEGMTVGEFYEKANSVYGLTRLETKACLFKLIYPHQTIVAVELREGKIDEN